MILFGLNIALGTLGFALGLIVLAIVLFFVVKRILVNTVLGMIALLAVNFFSKEIGLAFSIPITFVTVVITAILGLAGIGLLILLKLLGINVS